MSADEIRRLAESGLLESECGFGIDNDCDNACDADEIGECRQKKDIRAALLAFAAMVERCEAKIAEYKSYVDVGIVAENISDLNYILRGDAGKEKR